MRAFRAAVQGKAQRLHVWVWLHVQASQEQVDAVHKRFYDALEAMWHKHQPSFPEYKDVKLVMAYR